MSLEEILDPDGEHGTGIETGTEEEIIEKISLALEVADLEDQEADICIVGQKEALEAANTLQCFISDCKDEWAHTLKNTLVMMTHETWYEAVQTMKPT